MGKPHVNPTLLQLLAEGAELQLGELRQIAMHLTSCSECQTAYSTARAESRGTRQRPALSEATVWFEALRSEAERDLDELTKLAGGARQARVSRANDRFRNPMLVDLLIEESRGSIRRDPFEAQDLAEIAQDVAMRLSHSAFGAPWCMTSLARAKAHRGNAIRVQGDLLGAEAPLECAFLIHSQDGNGDPLVTAELASLLASLRNDQRRFEEGRHLLERVVTIYAECEETQQQGRALVKQGVLAIDAGEPREALAAVRRALELLDPAEDPHLHLCAEHNFVYYLILDERFSEAEQRWWANDYLYEAFADEPWWQLRKAWLGAKIDFGLKRLEAAEEGFQTVRRGFSNEKLGYHAALASLDLALLYVERGRSAKVRELAEELVPIFQAQDIHREAVAALLLFKEAAQQEAVTVEMVRELTAYLLRARRKAPERPS